MRPLDVTIPRLGSFCKLLLSLSPLPVISASSQHPRLNCNQSCLVQSIPHIPATSQMFIGPKCLTKCILVYGCDAIGFPPISR